MSEIWYTAQQPCLCPSIYMMERFARCHTVVVLDQAQIDRDNIRFKLMSKTGPLMVSPSLSESSRRRPFRECYVNLIAMWRTKTLTTFQNLYGKSIYYRGLKTWLETELLPDNEEDDLTMLCLRTCIKLSELLEMDTRFVLGSKLVEVRPSAPTEWMACFAEHLGATDYIQGGKSMQSYFKYGPFEHRKIRTWAQQFQGYYETWNGGEVSAEMSILDLLFSQGVPRTKRALSVAMGKGAVAGSAILVERANA